MRSQAFSGINRPGSAIRPGTNGGSPFDNTPPSLIVNFDDAFFKDRFRIGSCQKDALARINEAIRVSPMAKDEYEMFIGNFKSVTPNSRATHDDDGRAAIRMYHFSKYIQYVAKYEEINSTSPLRTKLPANVKPAVRKDFSTLTDAERSRFLIALAEFKKSYQWRWIVGLATGSFSVDESVAGANKQLRDIIVQGNTVLLDKAQLHFKEFCNGRPQPADMSEHGYVRPVSDTNAGSYANDASYALWNRCLLAEFETVLRTFDPEPSNPEPLALPYWSFESWLNPRAPTDGEGESQQAPLPTDFGSLPTAFTAPFVQVTFNGQSSLVPNPLLNGVRRAPVKSGVAPSRTARNPIYVDAFLEAQKVVNCQYFQNLLRNEDFASVSAQVTLPAGKNDGAQNASPARNNGPTTVTAPHMTAASFEYVTNYIQNLIGGELSFTATIVPPALEGSEVPPQPLTVTSNTPGDLATYESASWDPLFWLIRCNTDRLFCSWQRVHFRSSDAAAAIPKTINVNGQTRLFPFARLEEINQQRCWQMAPNGPAPQIAGREILIKKHTATMENWWSIVSLERYYNYDGYFELQSPEQLFVNNAKIRGLLVQTPHQYQGLAGDHNNTELEVTIGNVPHSGHLFAFYQTGNGGLRPLGCVSVSAAAEGSSAVLRFNVLDLLTGPTENPKRSMPPRDMSTEPFWLQDKLLLELRTGNRSTVLDNNVHKVQALFTFARFV